VPEKPTTLLERLNQVLESLALKIGVGGPPGIPSGGVASAAGSGNVPYFLDPIKRLLERIAQAAEKALGSKRESTSGAQAPSGGSKTFLDQFGGNTPGASSPSGGQGTTPYNGPLHQGDPSDKWSPAPDFQSAMDVLSPKEKALPPTGAAPAAGNGGMGTMDFKAWLGGSGGAGAGSQAAGGGQAAIAEGAAGGPMVMAALAAVKEAEKKFESFKGIGAELAGTLSKEGPGDVAGGVFGAGEKAGEAIGGPAGDLITKFSSMAKTVAESVDNLRRFDREILNASFRFAEYSAQMAAVEAQQEMRDIELGQRKGDAQAKSTERLAEAMSDLNNTMAPFENQWANFRNEILTKVTRIVDKTIESSGTLGVMAATLGVLATLLGAKGEPTDDDVGFDVTEQIFKAGEKYARPARFPE
jgi:hypothetical protein